MDGKEFTIMALIVLLGFILFANTLISKYDRQVKMTHCEQLYTNYMKTTADTLWLVNNDICPAPAKVTDYFKSN